MPWPEKTLKHFVSSDSSQAAQLTFIKLAPGVPEQDEFAPVTCSTVCCGGAGTVSSQTRPGAMAKNGLVICLLVIALLLDQSSSHTSKLKARKHSKRRVKEKDGDLKTQVEKLWREVNALKEMQALQTVCLRGTKVHKKCYLASEGPKHFHEANEDCIAKGGTLAVPRNTDEINALRDYGKRSLPGVNEIWLGINDLVTEGKFVDVNGVAISFLNWDRAQPNGGRKENCALLSQSAQGKWSDEVCRSSKRYICEFIIP